MVGQLVGFETTARPRIRTTYRKQIAENTLVAIFAVAHCPGFCGTGWKEKLGLA
jgi:hypothetical protein